MLLSSTQSKITGFLKLPVGWHYGKGRAPSKDFVAKALVYVSFYNLLGIEKTDAFPGIDGEIMVTGYYGTNVIETTLELDGTFRFCHEKGDVEIKYQEALSASGLSELLLSAAPETECEKWYSSGLSTPTTTLITTQVVSKTSPLDPSEEPMELMGYPVSNAPVRTRKAARYVNTSVHFTDRLPPRQPYFGPLNNPIFQKLVA
jgi:hypothetical protein